MGKIKKISYLVMCLLLIFILTGCEKTENNSENNSVSNSENSKNVSNDILELEKEYSNLKKDDLKWEYKDSEKTIVISGKGAMKSYLEEEPEWNYLNEEAEKVIIGNEVTSVGEYAFTCFTNIIEVDLGKSVEYIGENAFDNCICLENINFPNELKYVGSYAFNNDLLHSKTGFIFPQGMLYLGASSFRSALKESYVEIPKTLEKIENDAFNNCFVEKFIVDENNDNYKSIDGILYDNDVTTLINYPALKKNKIYEIPETVKTITKESIQVTNDLEKIVIPKNITSIEEGSIFWNYGLKYIEVAEENENYKSVDGVLYTKDGKYLLSYPIASERDEYTVLDSTIEIQMYSMSNANNLKKIFVKDGVKNLKTGAFYLCENLEELELPKTLEKIEEYVLEYNDKLKIIKYLSTESDWNKIKIENKNSTLKSNNLKIEYLNNN